MKKIQSVNNRQCNDNATELFQKKEIPIIKVDINGLQGLDDKLKKIKLCNYQCDFVTEIQKVLNLYDESELKYNDKLVLFVMQEVENFLLKAKCGESKKELVSSICKIYFNNEIDLVEMVINLVFHKLSQVKFIKRQCFKILRFFLKVRQSH